MAGLPRSPQQMLQSRELRTKCNSLHQKIFKPKIVVCSLENHIQNSKQIEWYDKTASSEAKQFELNEPIILQDKFSKQWSKAIVIGKTKWPRSYLVQNEKGNILRRNTIFMK